MGRVPPTPPSVDELVAALGAHRFHCDALSAAVFLASPMSCVPGPAAGAREGRAWIRDQEVEASGDPEAAAVAAVELVGRAHRDGDRYLSLGGDSSTWFKIVVSGTRRMVSGPSLLWGLPRVWAEDGVRPAQVATYVHLARRAALDSPPALVSSGTPFLLDGVGADVVLRVAPGGRAARPAGAAAGPRPVADEVADALGCVAVSASPIAQDPGTGGLGSATLRVVLRAWLPGAPGPRLVQARVQVGQGGWSFVDVVDDVPGPQWQVSASFDPGAGGARRGESAELASTWVAAEGHTWVHRATGARVSEVR